MSRLFGIFFGIATQLFFAITAYHLFWFLKSGYTLGHSEQVPSSWNVSYTILWNSVLALQFAIPHSILLHPTTRRNLQPWIRSSFYGCMFCCVTCINLWCIFVAWHVSPIVIWQASPLWSVVITASFYASWLALLYSISLTGLGYQTGLTPWWQWVRRQPPQRRPFEARSLYGWLRHPIYLSFLGLIWFTPQITLDRAVLLAIWTIYIYIGSILKDRRLEHYLGATYRRYAERVPGYPGILWGPLACYRSKPREPNLSSAHSTQG